MKILAFNPGHDGAVAYLKNGRLVFSIEAEKDSNYRYSPISSNNVFDAMGELDEIPNVICAGGWWPREQPQLGKMPHVGYRGIDEHAISVGEGMFLGKKVHFFSSTHERSHLLCAYGMSGLKMGTPCYVLLWEGEIGAFYEIDAQMKITLIKEVMNEPGNRYASVYGLADPGFPKDAPFSRFSDAGKLMALTSFSNRRKATQSEERLMKFLLEAPHIQLNLYQGLEQAPHYNIGTDDLEFRNFTGIFSDRIFDVFYRFAQSELKRDMPLLIVGGCGLNCDWNSKWTESGLFSSVFVPPVANDSGSAIGTAIDAQLYFTGNPEMTWDVYSGKYFNTDCTFDNSIYDCYEMDHHLVADMLANDLILAWVQGRYEIGPRALGNRSILAAPFRDSTRERLNTIKQREQFRPVAPISLEGDAEEWFGCKSPSPYMLYTFESRTDVLAAVTHVNGTARLQTVSMETNGELYQLLHAFKKITGFGVLCNTSLNFNGRGFINKIDDLASYVENHKLDGFIVGDKCYVLCSSEFYQCYQSKMQ